MKQCDYRFGPAGEFILDHYNIRKPFASFLPGIAGPDGIPMWAYYVNRGQAMASFGVGDRGGAMMEFTGANVLYRTVELTGFRTFLRQDGGIYELFSSLKTPAVRRMTVEKNLLHIMEEARDLGLRATVTYYTMPHQPYAALVRKLKLEAMDEKVHEVEVCDGLAQILPYGISNESFRAIPNLARAWFDVFRAEERTPFYRIRSSMDDTAEVREITAGNFFLAVSTMSDGLLPTLYDMNVLFGQNTAFTRPDGWDCPLEELLARPQTAPNKVSGAFSGQRVRIGPDGYALYSVFGHVASEAELADRTPIFTSRYLEDGLDAARLLADDLTANLSTNTADERFNRYVEQCYLDNILRGGLPVVFDEGKVCHIYARKHGDPEREYNMFYLEPSFYSQGNGNFRDVAQNRRVDVLLDPRVGSFNVFQFASLIQADGYNPLLVKGSTFTLEQEHLPAIETMLEKPSEELRLLLEKPFTPGALAGRGLPHEVMTKILALSRQNIEAEFGEGYWSDHWTYLMDLIDAYLAVFPDQYGEFLFGAPVYRYFYSPVYVLPRSRKYVAAPDGKVRQYGAIVKEKPGHPWLLTAAGEEYTTNLFAKLLTLAIVKFSTLDPMGMGIEMEGGRPGWNDALNGLPGLFGSGLSETAELLRLVRFLREASGGADIAAETAALFHAVEDALARDLTPFAYWDTVATAREEYRASIRQGIEGRLEHLPSAAVAAVLAELERKLEEGIERAYTYGEGGLPPAYFVFDAAEFTPVPGEFNPVNGYPIVKVNSFTCRALPAFLEAPARILKTLSGKAKDLYTAVKKSELYDPLLGMYKTSVSLEAETMEIGRLRAFTTGWLERESVFLHMEYKYLYAMLKAGLYEEFFADMKTALVPFLDPEVYGRSTLENSSFIASSTNPDPSTHGQGFVARLTGTTVEFLSMWLHMMCGAKPFELRGGSLVMALRPILPAWLFREDGTLSFTMFSHTKVTYRNPKRRPTFGPNAALPVRYTLMDHAGGVRVVEEEYLREEDAKSVRDGAVRELVMDLD